MFCANIEIYINLVTNLYEIVVYYLECYEARKPTQTKNEPNQHAYNRVTHPLK